MGLLAVMGPSRKDQRRGEPSFLWRYWSTTPLSYHQRRRSRSSAGKSARVSTCRNPVFLVVVIAHSPCQQKISPSSEDEIAPVVPPQLVALARGPLRPVLRVGETGPTPVPLPKGRGCLV